MACWSKKFIFGHQSTFRCRRTSFLPPLWPGPCFFVMKGCNKYKAYFKTKFEIIIRNFLIIIQYRHFLQNSLILLRENLCKFTSSKKNLTERYYFFVEIFSGLYQSFVYHCLVSSQNSSKTRGGNKALEVSRSFWSQNPI